MMMVGDYDERHKARQVLGKIREKMMKTKKTTMTTMMFMRLMITYLNKVRQL